MNYSIAYHSPCLDYNQLVEVRHVGAAQTAYSEAIALGTPDERKEDLRHSLLEYCKLDSLAMVRLTQFSQAQQSDKNK